MTYTHVWPVFNYCWLTLFLSFWLYTSLIDIVVYTNLLDHRHSYKDLRVLF